MSGVRIKVFKKDYTFFCYRLSSHYSHYRIKPLPAHWLHCAFSGCCSVGGGLRQWEPGHLDDGKQSCSWSDTSNLRTIFAVLTVILQFWQIMLLRCVSVLPPFSAECWSVVDPHWLRIWIRIPNTDPDTDPWQPNECGFVRIQLWAYILSWETIFFLNHCRCLKGLLAENALFHSVLCKLSLHKLDVCSFK